MSSPLFIFTQPPTHNAQAREGIEALLACAAFDQEPEVLLIDQAVFQLVPQVDQPGGKNLNRMVQAFEIYGVQSLFVCAVAIARFGIEPKILKPMGIHIDLPQRAKLIQNASWVARF